MRNHHLAVLITMQTEGESITRKRRGQYYLTRSTGTRVSAPAVLDLLSMGLLVPEAGRLVLSPAVDHPDYRNV